MGFASRIAQTWNDNTLMSVLVELTHRCNLACSYCYNVADPSRVALTTAQYVRLLEDLCEMGVLQVTFSGGEPTLHPDFLGIGARARELGFVVRVKSNGHRLQGELASRLRDEVDPYAVDLSLHGARAETHDRQTRVPGSFERLVANVREMQSLGLRVKLNCTLTCWNEHEIEDVLELADSLGVSVGIATTVSPQDNGDLAPLRLAASADGQLRLARFVTSRADVSVDPTDALCEQGERQSVDVKKLCGAGSNTLCIDPYGDVLPCVQWRQPIGNIHQTPVRAIWENSATLAEIRKTTTQAGQFVDSFGAPGRRMGFCPAMAEILTGNPLKIYPAARQQLEICQRLRREKSKTGPAG